MTDVFRSFVFNGGHHPKAEVEYAARALSPYFAQHERGEANDALLARLDKAKAEFQGENRDMLRDPEISTLVNVLLIINQGWLHQSVQREKRFRHLSEPVEELVSQAITGNGEVSGMMGAILGYDYQRCGTKAFTSYLSEAIRHAFILPPKQLENARCFRSAMRLPEEPNWADRRERPPEALAIDNDLLTVIQDAIRHLPKERRAVAEFIVGRILEQGERPTLLEIAANHIPPVSKARAAQITQDTINRLKHQVETLYPQLAEEGVNGWDEFKRAFGVTAAVAER